MGTRLDPRRLRVCVVTSATIVPGRGHVAIARAAIDGGATAVQLRAPELGDDELLPIARELAAVCDGAGVLFVVNDRVEVAVEAGAAGAHVGQGDSPDRARAAVGADMVLGISVQDVTEAIAARDAGADYVGVTVWPTPTKPEAVAAGIEGVGSIAEATSLPVLGIGGIDAGNAARVVRAGAAGVAVISAVVATPDPAAATRAIREVVDAAVDAREGAG